MQEKFNDLKKYAHDKSKRIIAKMRDRQDGDANIESYDGDDAYYTGSDEDYEEFLKSVEGETEEEAVPVENTQRVSLADTINLQGVIDKFKEKAGELTSAAKKFKDDISSQIEDFKAASAEKPEISSAEDMPQPDKTETEKVEPTEKITPEPAPSYDAPAVRMIDNSEFRDGMTAVAEGMSAVGRKIDDAGAKTTELADKLREIETRVIDGNEACAQSISDLKNDAAEIEQSIKELKQSTAGISKLADSIFDVKNTQVNTKNTLAELEMSFIKLKKKCIAGVTILSILSAIIIGLQIVLLLS